MYKGLILVLTCAVMMGVHTTTAQTPPVWQTAETIRSLAFDAQTELYAAGGDTQIAADYVEQAAQIYADDLQPVIVSRAPDVDAFITAALASAQAAAGQGDAPGLADARGRLWTGLLWSGYRVGLDALAQGDTERAADWLRLREYRQSTRVIDSPAQIARDDVAAGRLDEQAAYELASDDLRETYFFQLREVLDQLDAAADKQFGVRAAEWAGQAAGYFAILHDDFAVKRGTENADSVAALLVQLENGAIQGDWAAVVQQATAVRSALMDYHLLKLSEDTIQERAQRFYLFIDQVYAEYKDGVSNGAITAEIEYREARTFRDQAAVVFQDLRPIIAQADPAAADRTADLLSELDRVMEELGDARRVQALTTEIHALLDTTLDITPDDASLVVINSLLNEVVAAAQQGDYDGAEQMRIEAYAMFENGMELRIAHRAPRLSHELEGLFWEGSGGDKGLSTLLQDRADPAEIEAGVSHLKTKLDEAQNILASELTDTLAALNSAAIILREGLEAVLVLGAILGFIRTTDSAPRYSAWVYLGVVGAILLSVLTWWAAEHVITIGVQNRELMEGFTSLAAVVVLFYVTNWLFHKTYVIDWMTFVRSKLKVALSGGSALTLAGLGFTVVYREGFETVLFYRALLFDADLVPVLIGFVAGSTVIALVAYGILRMSKQIPIKQFFTATTVLLLLLAFNFTGTGVRELQEAGMINTTLLPSVPENLILMEIFGVFPTLETILAQGVFVLLIAATFTYSRWQGVSAAARPQGDVS